MTYKQQAEELNAEIKTLKEKKAFCKPHAELIQLSINKKLVFAEALKAKIEAVRQGLQDDIECFGSAGDDIKRLHDCQEAIKKLDEVLE